MRTETPPLVFRVPAYLVSLLFLVAAGLAAWNIYGSPSATLRIVTIPLAVLLVLSAIAGMRMYCVFDEDGIGLRQWRGEVGVDWSDVTEVTVGRTRNGSPTLRVVRRDAPPLDVPPSLVNSTRPMGTAQALARMATLAREANARRP